MNEIVFSGEIPGLFAEETLRKKEYSMPGRHFHDSLELYFLLEGERFFFIEQDTWHIHEGMAVLVNRGQIHKTSAKKDRPEHRRFLLQLEAPVLDRFFSLPNFPSIKDFGEQYWGAAEFSPSDWLLVRDLVNKLKCELENGNPKDTTLALLFGMQLIALFVRTRRQQEIAQRKHTLPSHQVHTGMYQKVHEIALYLQNNSSSPCSLDDIAAHFYISRPYLTRIFKSVTGFTVIEYLTVCRTRKAQLLLADTTLSITEIAARTGFGNITYFEKVFKQLTGLTPRQYRNQQQNPSLSRS